MPGFTKDAFATPFGRNVFLRSTQDIKTTSATVAASTVPARTIDGYPGQKILQPGTVLARITSGPEVGKVGPFQAAGTDEVQTITATGTWTGGTYTLTVLGATTAAITWNANAAAIQTAVRNAVAAANPTYDVTTLEVTGGPLNSTPVVITYNGALGVDVAAATINTASVTGTTPSANVVTTTAGAPGATDGRQTAANIVGICNTFLPWQLTERDVEVAVIYEAAVVQARCIELNAAGAEIALTNGTANAMIAQKSIDIKFF